MAHVLDSFSSLTATSSQRPHAAPRLFHRRYRITEGAEEIQVHRVAGHLFGVADREGRHARSKVLQKQVDADAASLKKEIETAET
jgi:hypothetical protein